MRPLKQWLCRVLIGAMLFAQLAVAAHACSGPAVVPGDEAAASNAAAVAVQAMDCEHMAMPTDEASPTVCAEHCRQGQQSDQAATLAVPVLLLTARYHLAPQSPPPWLPRPRSAEAGLLVAMSPPHSILHCCLRD